MDLTYEFEYIADGKLKELLLKYFTNSFRSGYTKVNGTVLPEYFKQFSSSIHNLNVCETDHWVVSFPKSGTTWTQEMVWCIANDLDFEAAKVPLQVRFPFLDHTSLFDYEKLLDQRPEMKFPSHVLDSVGFVNKLKSPRFIKSHFPWQVLPKEIEEKEPKVIYVARNAKDSCVSYYHHCRLMEGYEGTFDDFCELFLGDMLCFAPFWSHILPFWERRHKPNILFLKYEDMKKDLPAVIKRTAEFLGKQLTSDQIDRLTQHLSFNSMKNNPAVNYEDVIEINRKYNLISRDEISKGSFMRNGQVGDWKAKMSPEMAKRFDMWSDKHLAGTGLSFT